MNIQVNVTVNGRPVRVYRHDGKHFIESRVDTEYSIEIINNEYYRVEAVAAVDGLSVLTGNAASVQDRGYIINARDKIVIKGFRKDLDTVGAFKFCTKEASYAADKGKASNVGVISVAFFREQTPWSYTPQYFGTVTDSNIGDIKVSFMRSTNMSDATYSSNSIGTATGYASNTSFEHGTTWGAKLTDKVTSTSFERSSTAPLFVYETFYNSKENLQAMGVKIVNEKEIAFPVAFPADFATPPANWR